MTEHCGCCGVSVDRLEAEERKALRACEFPGRHTAHYYKRHPDEDPKQWYCVGSGMNRRSIETVDLPKETP